MYYNKYKKYKNKYRSLDLVGGAEEGSASASIKKALESTEKAKFHIYARVLLCHTEGELQEQTCMLMQDRAATATLPQLTRLLLYRTLSWGRFWYKIATSTSEFDFQLLLGDLRRNKNATRGLLSRSAT